VTRDNGEYRVVHTALGPLTITRCPIAELVTGDRIVSFDDTTVWEVTADCAHGENGWLFVRCLTMTDAEIAALQADPDAVEPGEDPRDGFYSCPPGTPMQLVVPHPEKEHRR
jgi:hypothetical protein